MTPGAHDMPVLDAYPLDWPFAGHWRAKFPEGERTYPSADAMRLAAARIGAAVRYHTAPASRPAVDDSVGLGAGGDVRSSPGGSGPSGDHGPSRSLRASARGRCTTDPDLRAGRRTRSAAQLGAPDHAVPAAPGSHAGEHAG